MPRLAIIGAFLFPRMDSQKFCSLQFLSAYILVGDFVRGHDCMDAGGRAKHSHKDVA